MGRKKKRDTRWSQDSLPQQPDSRINVLRDYWIPLLEQVLEQARRLLEKLERGRDDYD